MSQLLLSGKYSDFKLRCEDVEFQLHKSVVCMQSPMFAAALDGNFTVRFQLLPALFILLICL